jgi:hypothetical protein
LKESSTTRAAVGRAGRRATYHLLQAVVESLKALEAVIEELGGIEDRPDQDDTRPTRQRIEIE